MPSEYADYGHCPHGEPSEDPCYECDVEKGLVDPPKKRRPIK